MNTTQRLNEAQLSILGLFERQQLTPSELKDLHDTLVNFLDKKLQKELNKVVKQKNITAADIPHLGIKGNRTAYLKKIRSNK